MIAFTMMAVGLNIVVGYCGLLDLGYVAFYAVGAYTAGWLASQHFEQVTFHFGSSVPNEQVGHPRHDVGRADRRRAPDDARRHHHRPADAPPPRRLPRDRHARVRRDHPAGRPQRRQLRRLQPHERDVRHRADRPGRLPAAQRDRASRQLPDLGQPRAVVLPGRLPAAALHDLLLRAAARLAARARLDRDPRGRDRGRGDGRPADEDEDLGVRARRVLRRGRGRVLRELQVGRVPRGLLLQHLGLPALHGHPRRHGLDLGRARRRDDPRVPELQRPLDDRHQDPGRGARLRSDEVPVRDLRDHHRADDALPARRA